MEATDNSTKFGLVITKATGEGHEADGKFGFGIVTTRVTEAVGATGNSTKVTQATENSHRASSATEEGHGAHGRFN